jgi:hypothetical protein
MVFSVLIKEERSVKCSVEGRGKRRKRGSIGD